ncbi:MAG: type I-E CRISPR-associated protein Cse2/CasB [Chloroflexi bacterium]|nr:type I-E CRISPR-associated protein Cse2/CasB [Chloroflexota bacterium]
MGDPKPVKFIQHLRELRDDRGAMAALKRSLAFNADELGDVRAYRYVEPFVQGESEWRRHVYYLVAGLYALHSEEGEQSLAEVLSDLWQREQQLRSLESHFRSLLESDPDQLPDRLRRIVTYVRSKGASLNYERLLGDLLHWKSQNRWVQQRWARQFYRGVQVGGEGQVETHAEVDA